MDASVIIAPPPTAHGLKKEMSSLVDIEMEQYTQVVTMSMFC